MFIQMHLHVRREIEPDHIIRHAITEEIERQLEQEFGRSLSLPLITYHQAPLRLHSHVADEFVSRLGPA